MSGEQKFIYESLGSAPSEITLPSDAPDFVIVEGECYWRTNEKVLPNDIRTDYSGDFEDCDACLSIHGTPTLTQTPTVSLTSTPTPTLTPAAITPTLTPAVITPTLTPAATTPTLTLTPDPPPNFTPTLTPFNISSPCSNPASSSISFTDERIGHFFNTLSCLWSYDEQKFLDDNQFISGGNNCTITGYQFLSTAVTYAFKSGLSVDESWIRSNSFGGPQVEPTCGTINYSGSIPLEFPINPHQFSISEIGSTALSRLEVFNNPPWNLIDPNAPSDNQGNQIDSVLATGEIGNINPNPNSKWSSTSYFLIKTLAEGNSWEIMNEMYTKFFNEFKV